MFSNFFNYLQRTCVDVINNSGFLDVIQNSLILIILRCICNKSNIPCIHSFHSSLLYTSHSITITHLMMLGTNSWFLKSKTSKSL